MTVLSAPIPAAIRAQAAFEIVQHPALTTVLLFQADQYLGEFDSTEAARRYVDATIRARKANETKRGAICPNGGDAANQQ